jgi:hypothetical protein
VFSGDGIAYAAPSLIFRYVPDHHYRPPDEFVRTMNEGLHAPDPHYLERLIDMDHDWHNNKFLDANRDLAIPRRQGQKKYHSVK